MKILVNRTPKLGPWGGGAKTVNKLVSTLHARGHKVVHKLEDGVDVIFCIDPRPNEVGEWYQDYLFYKAKFGAKIIQRVGDLGTHSKPELTKLLKSCYPHSDFLIFPSQWARDYIPVPHNNSVVIDNAPMKIFHSNKNTNLAVSEKPKLVTHHWSTNPKKGFEIYEQLQSYIKATGEYEFTYIGRLPENVRLDNHVQPVGAKELSTLLPSHDIYITASKEEAGANHVLEAMAAGLPVVYHAAGGSINNYCKEYGEVFFGFDGLLESITRVITNYKNIKSKVLTYEKDNSCVVEDYVDIIERFGDEKE